MAYYSSNPYQPAMGTYAMYTTTASVPVYAVNSTLMSLNNDESRIHAEMQQLREREMLVRRHRAAALRRLRAQRLASVVAGSMGHPAYDDTTEEDDFEDEDDEEQLNEQIRYAFRGFPAEPAHREGYERARRLSHGLPRSREYRREILVREILDPTTSPHTSIPFPIPIGAAHQAPYSPHHHHGAPPFGYHHHHHYHQTPQVQPQRVAPTQYAFVDPPVIEELSPSIQAPPTQPQYVPETHMMNKRGSRRGSIRRDSVTPTQEPPRSAAPTVAQTLQKYTDLRGTLMTELGNIPDTIVLGVAPTFEEREILQQHMRVLEEILLRVDSVEILEDLSPEDRVSIRRARGELVTSINSVLVGIEQHLQPGTPSGSAGSMTVPLEREEEKEDVDDVAFSETIHRSIQETLGRKKDEGVLPRRSVTVEDVPDAQY
jgi:hypothetical protein